ncbi:hypothetical protein PISL3812_01543 [Talaromyces islandicus]|uniref:Uncharacterized protein n=1 Tax=Talaromyces islandicus TaxID=28573 RepID=A0A0U1LMM9_TALIS|nr:hypothetical protein PISL3812_01543 [Talaromyces islandicus]
MVPIKIPQSTEEYLSLSINNELHSVPSYEIQLVSNLVYYYSQSARNVRSKKSWLLRLPAMAQSAELPRMRALLLAPSLILLATQSQQQSVFKEALKWYDRGLSYLRKRLKSAGSIPDNEMDLLVPAALLMSFYEAINPTLDSGYEQHLLGAITLLEAKGPETFASPKFHDLFLAVRGHAVTVSLMTGKSTFLAEERWLTVPFMHTDKSPLDRINDCLLVMMNYISQLEVGPVDWTNHIEPPLDGQSTMVLSGLMSDLDEIWSQISHWEIPRVFEDDSERGHDSSEFVYTYSNAHQANSVAIYSLARLILLLLLDRQISSHFTLSADKEGMMMQASASILSAARYLSTFDIGCAYLRIITPLQIVAQHSPSSAQRDCAVHILQKWWAERPLKGLTWKALQRIASNNKKSIFLSR